jgi:DNA repair exonuclease SbcCD ATPase subunit
MMMKTDFEDYKEMMYDVRRTLGSEKERLKERVERLDGFIKMADATDELLSEIENLKEENEILAGENDRLRKEVEEKEMKLSELGKLSVGVAKKSSQDEVLKALRTYINISKRKTLSKRVAVKMMIMELANAIGLVFPEDMIATLETLDDDEQTEPKVLVQGDYVENKGVENKYNAPVGQVIEHVDKLEAKVS